MNHIRETSKMGNYKFERTDENFRTLFQINAILTTSSTADCLVVELKRRYRVLPLCDEYRFALHRRESVLACNAAIAALP